MQISSTKLIYSYFLLGFALSLSEYGHYNLASIFIKPLLMPLLLIYVRRMSQPARPLKLLMGALTCSWIGDIFLLFPENANAFSAGLAAFLVAHSCYCINFGRKFNWQNWRRWPIVLASLGIVMYVSLFFNLIQDKLAQLQQAVVIYMLLLALMVIMAFWRYAKSSKLSFMATSLGAVCFVFSDSMLALNKFVEYRPLSASLIIISYVLAQFLLTIGCIEASK